MYGRKEGRNKKGAKEIKSGKKKIKKPMEGKNIGRKEERIKAGKRGRGKEEKNVGRKKRRKERKKKQRREG